MTGLNVSKITLGLSAALFSWPSLAAEFTCANLTQIRYVPRSSEPTSTAFPEIARLHLDINKAQPGNSTMLWSGTPQMEGISSNWPSDTKIIESNGMIAASYSAASDGVASVGSVTIDAHGPLKTRSTLRASS